MKRVGLTEGQHRQLRLEVHQLVEVVLEIRFGLHGECSRLHEFFYPRIWQQDFVHSSDYQGGPHIVLALDVDSQVGRELVRRHRVVHHVERQIQHIATAQGDILALALVFRRWRGAVVSLLAYSPCFRARELNHERIHDVAMQSVALRMWRGQVHVDVNGQAYRLVKLSCQHGAGIGPQVQGVHHHGVPLQKGVLVSFQRLVLGACSLERLLRDWMWQHLHCLGCLAGSPKPLRNVAHGDRDERLIVRVVSPSAFEGVCEELRPRHRRQDPLQDVCPSPLTAAAAAAAARHAPGAADGGARGQRKRCCGQGEGGGTDHGRALRSHPACFEPST
mmetsp:Transcript_57868/g.163959  ORF Transcript_57868/g.163959 Transcript_57868/m.163959 type:complete len:333 (-) Transcript_57868:2-1000(-)